MLKGKTIILGVTGSIAAYKIADLSSRLIKQNADVHVIMTKNATNFINPITFETLTGNKCLIDTFDRDFEFSVEHVSLAKRADAILIAPATANVIGKMANGIADDMLTTTVLACKCPKLVSPAMNSAMYENPIVRDNIDRLRKYGFEIIEPQCGYLACGDTGIGKMAEPAVLFEYLYNSIAFEKDLIGKKVLITAGPTREAIDPVRYITNHSSGKMGYAFAKVCAARGAKVKLISGPVGLEKPLFCEITEVESAKEMFESVKENFDWADIVIKAAAVADYTPQTIADQKIKKSDNDLSIDLKRTDDILAYVGEHKRPNQFICGFSMETENVEENSKAKLEKKNADMIVANSVVEEGAGFGVDTNVVTLITLDETKKLPCMSKTDVADYVMNEILRFGETQS